MRRLLHIIADYIRETDKLLFILCVTASMYGCLLVLSATHFKHDYTQFFVQFAAVLLGVAAAVIISLFDYKTISKRWMFYVGLCGVLLVLTMIYGYAPAGSENKAWIELPGGISFQASELVKITFIITFARHANYLGEKINKLYHIVLLCIHGATPVLLIHFLQGDDGTALIMAFIFLAMLFVAGIKGRYFAIAGVIAAVSAPFYWFFFLNEYQRSRFLIIFNPEGDNLGIGWQQWQGRIAIGSGGFFGYGLFKGPRIQNGTVPKAYNDFIFASAGEELGFLGCVAIIILLIAIMMRILRVSATANDKMASVMCTGVFAMFGAQAIINIGMCLSVLPVIGVTLPFFSAGGTSLVCLYLGIGLIVSIYMHRNKRQVYLRDDS